jgi:hypothetical protein
MSANQPEQSTSASIPSAEDVESEGTEDANGAQRQIQPIDRLPIFSCMAAHTTARMPSRPLLLEGWSSNHENPRLEPDSRHTVCLCWPSHLIALHIHAISSRYAVYTHSPNRRGSEHDCCAFASQPICLDCSTSKRHDSGRACSRPTPHTP